MADKPPIRKKKLLIFSTIAAGIIYIGELTGALSSILNFISSLTSENPVEASRYLSDLASQGASFLKAHWEWILISLLFLSNLFLVKQNQNFKTQLNDAKKQATERDNEIKAREADIKIHIGKVFKNINIFSKTLNEVRNKIRSDQRDTFKTLHSMEYQNTNLHIEKMREEETNKLNELLNEAGFNFVASSLISFHENLPNILTSLRNCVTEIIACKHQLSPDVKVHFLEFEETDSDNIIQYKISNIHYSDQKESHDFESDLIRFKVQDFRPLIEAVTSENGFSITNNSSEQDKPFPLKFVSQSSSILTILLTHEKGSRKTLSGALVLSMENAHQKSFLDESNPISDPIYRISRSLVYNIDSIYESIYFGQDRLENEIVSDKKLRLDRYLSFLTVGEVVDCQRTTSKAIKK